MVTSDNEMYRFVKITGLRHKQTYEKPLVNYLDSWGKFATIAKST